MEYMWSVESDIKGFTHIHVIYPLSNGYGEFKVARYGVGKVRVCPKPAQRQRELAFKPDQPVASDSAANFGFQKFRISHVSYKQSYKPHSLATTIKKKINNTTAK